MKQVILAVFLALALIVPSRAFSCRTEPERCGDGECCVEFGMFGRCRALLDEGEDCELRQLKSSFDKHVYMMMCPCNDGLTCEETEGGSRLLGKCVKK